VRRAIDRRIPITAVLLVAVVAAVVVAVRQPSDTPSVDLRNGRIFIQDNLWTADDAQYAVWVRPDGTPMVGRRPHGADQWETADLDDIAGNPLAAPTVDDEHRVYALGVDSVGHIHVVGNMHSTPLRYVRSTAPGDVTTWARDTMAGPTTRVTYPRFVSLPDGTLLFVRREGEAGDAVVLLDELLPGERTWRHVGTILDGQGNESPYLHRIAVDPRSGSLHLMFEWRTAGPDTTADVSYARSDDGGRTWVTSEGRELSLPMTRDDAEVVLETEPIGSGLVNQGGLDLDGNGNPHGAVLFAHGGERRIVYLWRDGDRWQRRELDGSLIDGRPSVAVTRDGRRWLLGSRHGELVAVDISGQSAGERVRWGAVPAGWEVSYDSRLLADTGRLETLVPNGDRPDVLVAPIDSAWPRPG
jgi:hypothetical protein